MWSWTCTLRGIFDLVIAQFGKAEDVAFANIIQYLGHLDPASAQADAVAEALYSIVNKEYNVLISEQDFKELIHKQTSTIYKDLVRNDALLPRVSFGLPDERAMRYLDSSDLVYLGRYVNDTTLRTRIIDYVRETYLERGAAIGNSPKELQAFIKEFGDELDLTKFQIRKIIDTTVSRARVFGQVNGMRASGAQTFEISGPDDKATCGFCREMLGRQFSVALEIADQDKFLNAGPENANYVRPFLKGSLSLDDLSNLADEEVQAQGFAVPPYHPLCRHRLTVVSFYANIDEIPYALG